MAGYGRNVDHFVNLAGGVVFLVAGMAMMTVLHTDLNVLNFSLTNCVVSFLIGLALLDAGLYGKTRPAAVARAENQHRRGQQLIASAGSGAPASVLDATDRSRQD